MGSWVARHLPSGAKKQVGGWLISIGVGADLSLVLVGSGSAKTGALVGFQVAIVAGCAWLLWGLLQGRQEGAAAALERRDQAMAAHHKDLSEYAHTMKLLLGQRETPWRTTPVYYQFQEHFPELVGPVNVWLKMVKAEQSPYFRADPQWRQTRTRAELEVGEIARGRITGRCSRCVEIDGQPQGTGGQG